MTTRRTRPEEALQRAMFQGWPNTKKRSKYGNVPTEVDGIMFASKREAQRYATLKAAESAGMICGLELQPRYPIRVNGVKICTYVADFRYLSDGQGIVIEDCKGHRTRLYKIKKALMKAVYGIEVIET